jgi:hypothetical protein
MTTGVFFLATLALPSGYDLTDGRGAIFYVFLFAPLALSGIGNALLHNTLRQGPRGRIIAVAGGIALLLFFLYWVTNSGVLRVHLAGSSRLPVGGGPLALRNDDDPGSDCSGSDQEGRS